MVVVKIKTETGVAIILATAILAGIFTVVGFEKTSKEIDEIQRHIMEIQAVTEDNINNKIQQDRVLRTNAVD